MKSLFFVLLVSLPILSHALPEWKYIPPVNNTATVQLYNQGIQSQQQGIHQLTNAISKYAQNNQKQKEIERLEDLQKQMEDERKSLQAEQKRIREESIQASLNDYYAKTPYVIVTDERGNRFRCLEGKTNISEDICHYVED